MVAYDQTGVQATGRHTPVIPSPLRDRVRGGQACGIFFPGALPVARVSPVAYFPDGMPAPANRPKWNRARNVHPSIGNSKTVEFGCCVISSTHRASHPAHVVREVHAGRRPVPDGNELPRKKSRANVCRLDIVAGICRRKTAGRAGWPKIFSLPRWNLFAACGRWHWDSSRAGLTEADFQFKAQLYFMAGYSSLPLFSTGGGIERAVSMAPMAGGAYRELPPLTLALSPLRGEGNVQRHVFGSRMVLVVAKLLFTKALTC